MATEIWVNIGSGNGLLPDGTNPLPEPMLTDHQWSPSDIHIRAISQEMPQPSSIKICLKITYLNFHSNFPWVNELIFLLTQYTVKSLIYKTHFSRQFNCWSLRCSWSIACRHCSNYIFILHLTLGFNILRKDNCKPWRETFKFWDLVLY